MSIAYVLISCEIGEEKSLIDELKSLPNVKEVTSVIGIYDVIIKLGASSDEEIKDIVVSKIRNIQKVRTTLTLTTIESQG